MNHQLDSLASYQGFKYIPTLDGWRAAAVLGVVFFHSLHNGLQPGSLLFRLAIHSCLGVDMFFAISGFLICGKLLSELKQTNTISLKTFLSSKIFQDSSPAIDVFGCAGTPHAGRMDLSEKLGVYELDILFA